MKVYDIDTRIALCSLIRGQSTYSPPDDMWALLGLWFGNGDHRRKLVQVSADEILRFDDSMLGSPIYFAILNDLYRIYPIPEGDLTNGLMVVYDPEPAIKS